MTMNRRTFTRLGALGAAFASVPIVSGCTAQKRSGLDVLIIGGGLSGLAAGWELKKGGFERFAVLEARDRVGGRTLNQTVNGAPVEAGANLIGGGQTAMSDLVPELGIGVKTARQRGGK